MMTKLNNFNYFASEGHLYTIAEIMDIGFDFSFYDQNYNNIFLSSTSLITFGEGDLNVNGNLINSNINTTLPSIKIGAGNTFVDDSFITDGGGYYQLYQDRTRIKFAGLQP